VAGGEVMVYRNEHNCDMDCTRIVAYVRIEGKWTKIGYYGSECRQFEALDLQQEEHDRLDKERMMQIRAQLMQIKQENRARLQRMNNSFFK
jgi:hypothetical protein